MQLAQSSMFHSSIILLLQTWKKIRSGVAIDPATEFTPIDKTLNAFKTLELQ